MSDSIIGVNPHETGEMNHERLKEDEQKKWNSDHQGRGKFGDHQEKEDRHEKDRANAVVDHERTGKIPLAFFKDIATLGTTGIYRKKIPKNRALGTLRAKILESFLGPLEIHKDGFLF